MYIQTTGNYTIATTSGSDIVTISNVTDGGVYLGQDVSGAAGLPAESYISGYANYNEDGTPLTGRGGAGTYRVSKVATSTASGAISAVKPSSVSVDYAVYYPGQSHYWSRYITKKSYNTSNGQTTLTFNSTVTKTFSGGSILMYFYGATEDNATLLLDKLLNNISSGTTFKMGMSLDIVLLEITVRHSSLEFLMDASNPDSDGTLSIILADELPLILIVILDSDIMDSCMLTMVVGHIHQLVDLHSVQTMHS